MLWCSQIKLLIAGVWATGLVVGVAPEGRSSPRAAYCVGLMDGSADMFWVQLVVATTLCHRHASASCHVAIGLRAQGGCLSVCLHVSVDAAALSVVNTCCAFDARTRVCSTRELFCRAGMPCRLQGGLSLVVCAQGRSVVLPLLNVLLLCTVHVFGVCHFMGCVAVCAATFPPKPGAAGFLLSVGLSVRHDFM